MKILVVPFVQGILGQSAVVSSYVKNHQRKMGMVEKGVVPSDSTGYGPIRLSWIQDENVYKATWKSGLTNSVTTLSKIGHDKFLVSRASPCTESSSFIFKDKESAIKAFFYNTDLHRTQDHHSEEARTWMAEHFKRAEGLKSIQFNSKKMIRAQRNFDKLIKVGRNREHVAKLIGIDINGDKIRIRIQDPVTKRFGKERTVSSHRAWYE